MQNAIVQKDLQMALKDVQSSEVSDTDFACSMGSGVSELNPEVMEKLARLEFENKALKEQLVGESSEHLETLQDDLDDARRLQGQFEVKYFNAQKEFEDQVDMFEKEVEVRKEWQDKYTTCHAELLEVMERESNLQTRHSQLLIKLENTENDLLAEQIQHAEDVAAVQLEMEALKSAFEVSREEMLRIQDGILEEKQSEVCNHALEREEWETRTYIALQAHNDAILYLQGELDTHQKEWQEQLKQHHDLVIGLKEETEEKQIEWETQMQEQLEQHQASVAGLKKDMEEKKVEWEDVVQLERSAASEQLQTVEEQHAHLVLQERLAATTQLQTMEEQHAHLLHQERLAATTQLQTVEEQHAHLVLQERLAATTQLQTMKQQHDNELQQERSSARTQLELSEEQRENVEHQLDTTRLEMNNFQQAHSVSTEEHENQLEKLQISLHLKEEFLVTVQKEYSEESDKISLRIERGKAEILKLRNTNGTLRNTLGIKEKLVTEMENELVHLRSSTRVLERERTALSSQIQEKRETHYQQSSMTQQMETQLSIVRSELEELTVKYNAISTLETILPPSDGHSALHNMQGYVLFKHFKHFEI